MSIAPKGQDIRFSEERIEQGRNFCNKLWNVCRFRQMSGIPKDNSIIELILLRLNQEQLTKDDHAILLRLADTLDEVDKLYQEYEFNSVLHCIYHFFWTDFCDWYIEVSKPRMADSEAKETCLAIQDICIRQILLAPSSVYTIYYRRALVSPWLCQRSAFRVSQRQGRICSKH